jgi:cyclopropane-fatty-acyl-phospholipid synthase
VGVLDTYLRRVVDVGDLRVDEGDGRWRAYGDATGPQVAVRFARGAALKLALQPELKLGECYMDGELSFEAGDMLALMEIVSRNPKFWDRPHGPLTRLRFAAQRRLQQANGRRMARRNVSHHYDLSYELYSRFLDADMQYSCAYFATPETTLEQAQAAKKAHIVAKLALPEQGRALDIGCGWGGLGLMMARSAPGLHVHGVTLSTEQLAVARRRAQALGMDDRVAFELRDYRDLEGPYQRIASVGMFEHVGQPHYQEFFDTAARLLSDDGVMLLHSIGRRTRPGVTQPFVAKYIFPGGYVPALSEVLPAIERAGLWVTDVEILRLHYAETLKEWRKRFHAQWREIAELYDERFCRMWEAYLVFSEAGFRWFGMMNFQIQLTKRVDALPITRDYMARDEAALGPVAATAPPAMVHAAE